MQSLKYMLNWMNFSINRVNDSPISLNYIEFPKKNLETFILLLNEDSVVEDFLLFDNCNVLADKYLLAITFIYFVRAKLDLNQYTRKNFFSSLYLAHLMEEDDETSLDKIIPWYDGKNLAEKKRGIINNKIELWHKMNFRTLVSKRTCEEIINVYPDSNIWKRLRPECHSGVMERASVCHECKINASEDSWLKGFLHEDDLFTERFVPTLAPKRGSKRQNDSSSDEPPAKIQCDTVPVTDDSSVRKETIKNSCSTYLSASLPKHMEE